MWGIRSTPKGEERYVASKWIFNLKIEDMKWYLYNLNFQYFVFKILK